MNTPGIVTNSRFIHQLQPSELNQGPSLTQFLGDLVFGATVDGQRITASLEPFAYLV